MFENYFDINGKRYYSGTILIINHMNAEVNAVFVCRNAEKRRYVYQINGCNYNVSEKYFQNVLVRIIDNSYTYVRTPTVKTKNDLDIDSLFIGWVWYITLMLLSSIFKAAIGLWILISIVFFRWRRKKIKEEGTYYEW